LVGGVALFMFLAGILTVLSVEVYLFQVYVNFESGKGTLNSHTQLSKYEETRINEIN